jgi:hypothetical protein
MSAKHTPGPWIMGMIAPSADTAIITDGHGTRVANVHADQTKELRSGRIVEVLSPEAQANARLVAAAPDLANVAQLFLDFYNLPTEEFVAKHGHGVSTKTLGDAARAALRKAGVLP